MYEGSYAEHNLKSHCTKGCDHKPKLRVGTRAERPRAAITKKRGAVQQQQEKVPVVPRGVELDLEGVYESKYLGFSAGLWLTRAR